MPTIKIFRKKEGIIRYNAFVVYLDGKRIGQLSSGKSNEFDVLTGQHKIKAKTWWYGSKDFNFTLFNKEKKDFTISTNKSLMIVIPILILIHIFLSVFLDDFKFAHIFALISLALIGVIVAYFLTVGRNNYLIIKEG